MEKNNNHYQSASAAPVEIKKAGGFMVLARRSPVVYGAIFTVVPVLFVGVAGMMFDPDVLVIALMAGVLVAVPMIFWWNDYLTTSSNSAKAALFVQYFNILLHGLWLFSLSGGESAWFGDISVLLYYGAFFMPLTFLTLYIIGFVVASRQIKKVNTLFVLRWFFIVIGVVFVFSNMRYAWYVLVYSGIGRIFIK